MAGNISFPLQNREELVHGWIIPQPEEPVADTPLRDRWKQPIERIALIKSSSNGLLCKGLERTTNVVREFTFFDPEMHQRVSMTKRIRFAVARLPFLFDAVVATQVCFRAPPYSSQPLSKNLVQKWDIEQAKAGDRWEVQVIEHGNTLICHALDHPVQKIKNLIMADKDEATCELNSPSLAVQKQFVSTRFPSLTLHRVQKMPHVFIF